MSAPSESVLPSRNVSPIEAFSGGIPRTKTRPLYQAGLGIVAFAMVLLPLIYLALIGTTAWAVLFHLQHDRWIFNGASGRGALFLLILYLGPAVAGAILVFFMVKPFFAAKAAIPDPITLDPAKEPLLFAFVERICGLVGAPVPGRIDVDCQVNASASLQRGLWSRDLVLTIGLPLASGLDMRQFAGVLAHEFGHFAQGAGMRLTYVIRKINFWFARVVYERDAWDLKLEQAAKGTDWRIGIVFHASRGCVWVTRLILKVLMHAGHAISCFMLRQMEYDADSYEAKLSGSAVFEATAAQLGVLNVATQIAYEDVRQSWASNRLPENLPLLIDHKAGTLSSEIHQKLSASAAGKKTGWFDTHPCDADRIRAVRRLNEPGVFHLAEPSARLFRDFAALSKTVTRNHYEKHFELEFTDKNLMPAEEILRESAASAEADAMVRKFYGGVNLSLHALLATGELPAVEDRNEAVARWSAARLATDALRAAAETCSNACIELHSKLASLFSARHLAGAGFQLEAKQFGLPESSNSPGSQEFAAGLELDALRAMISVELRKIEPFMSALRDRVGVALRLGRTDTPGLNVEGAEEATQLARLLAAVGAEMPRAHELSSKLNGLLLLAQNRGRHSEPSKVEKVASGLAAELQAVIDGIQKRLEPFDYPFPHARGPLTVADYVRSELPSENPWQRAYVDGTTHVERLFALHYRLVGRILARASAVESALDQR